MSNIRKYLVFMPLFDVVGPLVLHVKMYIIIQQPENKTKNK